MKSIKNAMPRLAVLLAVLFTGVFAARGATPNPTVFSTKVHRPTGITASPTLLLVAPQSCPVAVSEASTLVCGAQASDTQGPTTIYSLDGSGNATPFTSLEAGAVEDQEVYLATVPSTAGGWTAGDVYAARGKYVYKIANAGVAISGGVNGISSHFSTPCTVDNQHIGITFDQVGTFNHNMIITCGEEATVYVVDSTGTPTSLTTLMSPNNGILGVTEGPAVTPAGFCPSPTCTLPASFPPASGNAAPSVGSVAFAAQENQENIYSITSGGTTATFNHSNTFMEPEGVIVVPAPPCTFKPTTDTGYAYFIADQANDIVISYPLSDFSSLNGDLLVPNEYPGTSGQGIDLVDGTTGTLGVFDGAGTDPSPAPAGQYITHEGSAFVTCIAPPANMPLTKTSSSATISAPTGGFTFGLYPGTPTTAGTPNGFAASSSPNYGSIVQAVVPPTDILTITPPFAGTVCELDFPAGWTFSSWGTVTFTGGSGNSASAVYTPTGATNPQQRCRDLVIGLGTTNIALNIVDSPPTATIATTLLTASPLTAPGSETDSSAITVSSGGPAPTGNVTYKFFSTASNCTGTSTSEVVAISGGLVPDSSAHTGLAAGNYSFNATWVGDSNYAAPPTAVCEPFTVNAVVTGTGFCSPGYWKTHSTSPNWKIPTSTTLGSIFTIPSTDYVFKTTTWIGSQSFLTAVGTGGGGFSALSRDVVNAYLGSLVFGTNALYSTADVITMANAAYISGVDPFTGTESCPLN